MKNTADATIYEVVVNDEQQHSIWPVNQPVPHGWYPVGFRGEKTEALTHIETIWPDIAPLSVRNSGSTARQSAQDHPGSSTSAGEGVDAPTS